MQADDESTKKLNVVALLVWLPFGACLGGFAGFWIGFGITAAVVSCVVWIAGNENNQHYMWLGLFFIWLPMLIGATIGVLAPFTDWRSAFGKSDRDQ